VCALWGWLGTLASLWQAFKYQRFELDDDLYIVVRCEVDASLEGKDGNRAYMTIQALNEFDPAVSGVNWRQKLDSQRAAVLANELKNNRNKLARWTCQAPLLNSLTNTHIYIYRHPCCTVLLKVTVTLQGVVVPIY
jgi:translation initiation factor 3 subunit D